MSTLTRTLDDVYKAAGIPEGVDDFDYVLEVIAGRRAAS